MRALSLLLLLVARAALADPVDDWVREKIAAQRAGAAQPPPPTVDASGQLWATRPAAGAPVPQFSPPTSLAPLVKAVKHGVVYVTTTNVDDTVSRGSGFVINPDGLVVTNTHVIEKARSILVRLSDGRALDAMEAGRDKLTDVALIRIPDVHGLPTVTLGDSDQLEIGDWVVVIGNPLGLENSVTHGLISAREREIGVGPFDDFIQTNALINPGNSGGPVFDMRGDVVGVATAVMSQGQGIGFAVPINMVKDLLPNLLANGTPERGWLGLNVQEGGEGAGTAPIVVDVIDGSPAAVAGVRPGDRVVAIGGKPVQRWRQLLRRVALQKPGTTVKVEVLRGGRKFEFTATLAMRPSIEAARARTTGGLVGRLGLALKALDPNAAASLGTELGLRVEDLVAGGPGASAGLAVGDVVVEINRLPVVSLREVEAALAEIDPAEAVLLKFRRGQTLRYLAVTPRR